MVTLTKPLTALTAADLMSKSLVMIPQDMSLSGAAHLLAQAHVSGAPVVNAEGRCIGVLSSTDFVHWADNGRKQHLTKDCVCSSWQIVDNDVLPREEVRHYMTNDPVTVEEGMHIADLARRMLDAHIHRVIVVNENGRPIGLVSSTDILAAVAYMTVEEAN